MSALPDGRGVNEREVIKVTIVSAATRRDESSRAPAVRGAAADATERRKAAQRFRATTWNTPVVNVQERLRSGKREEPPRPNNTQ